MLHIPRIVKLYTQEQVDRCVHDVLKRECVEDSELIRQEVNDNLNKLEEIEHVTEVRA